MYFFGVDQCCGKPCYLLQVASEDGGSWCPKNDGNQQLHGVIIQKVRVFMFVSFLI
jgi:hypothetical protein